MLRLVDRAIQLHGALGITSDTVLAHYYVHERGARIYDGPDEVHKMVVAKRILARYCVSDDRRSAEAGARRRGARPRRARPRTSSASSARTAPFASSSSPAATRT